MRIYNNLSLLILKVKLNYKLPSDIPQIFKNNSLSFANPGLSKRTWNRVSRKIFSKPLLPVVFLNKTLCNTVKSILNIFHFVEQSLEGQKRLVSWSTLLCTSDSGRTTDLCVLRLTTLSRKLISKLSLCQKQNCSETDFQ